MAGAAQLLRGGHARRAGADDRDRLAGFALAARRLRRDPALLPGAVDDRVLDLLDRDRVALADLEHARRLARRRAQAAGELGEVVGRVQLRDRVREAVAVDEVVPVGDQVAERAAVVAERHAAVHAARALLAQLRDRAREQELAVVVDALGRVALGDAVPLDLQEAAELAHQPPVSPTGVERTRAHRTAVARGARRERLFLGELAQHALVVVRHHLHERARRAAAPTREHARGDRRVGAAQVLFDQRAQLDRVGLGGLLRSRPCPCCSAARRCRPRRARRRRRRSCRPRSCARSARARRRARRSCTRSRGRRRPRRPPTRRSCAPRSARPRGRGRRRARRSRRRARCCRRSRSPRPRSARPCPRAGGSRRPRRRGPCRRSRWRRRAA